MAFVPSSETARARLASLQGRRVGVVGLGREGIDLTRFLAPFVREIVVSDRASADSLTPSIIAVGDVPSRYILGAQREEDLLDCDEIFVSPGVPKNQPVVAVPAAAGVPISSATRLLFDLFPGPILGVTGSSGKTTTTSMVGAMLAREGFPSALGGNIGVPLLGHLAAATTETWCILELSSFQLEDLTRSPKVAVLLNIFPDHLDRHRNMQEYAQAKGNVVRHQNPEDTAVLNADDSMVASLPHASKTRTFSLRGESPAWFDGEHLWLDPHPAPVMRRSDLRLLGLHNVANALAALLAAQATGCSVEAMGAALRNFRAIRHRLEVVGTVEAVTYINDSIATTPGRSSAALRAIDEPIVLIVGGRHKNVPMNEWAEIISRRARAVVVVGEAAPLIKAALKKGGAQIPILSAKSFGDTVALAHEAAEPGDVVLLSPGCASFDEFPDYAARGEAFREGVAALGRRYREPM